MIQFKNLKLQQKGERGTRR